MRLAAWGLPYRKHWMAVVDARVSGWRLGDLAGVAKRIRGHLT